LREIHFWLSVFWRKSFDYAPSYYGKEERNPKPEFRSPVLEPENTADQSADRQYDNYVKKLMDHDLGLFPVFFTCFDFMYFLRPLSRNLQAGHSPQPLPGIPL
jgi:hypothetical protein